MTMARLCQALEEVPQRIIACSGGVDSLLLATVAHRAMPATTLVAHAVTPAVPSAATARVLHHASKEGWSLRLVRSREFDDERYLSNPRNRCYFCKSHLYAALRELRCPPASVCLSGANIDDLAEYRPGLTAAAENAVRHPFVEAGIGKTDIRKFAKELGLDFADLPASPCLASRLYTGTAVTPARLHAVEVGEDLLRLITGVTLARCRVDGDTVRVEIGDDDRASLSASVLHQVGEAMRRIEPTLSTILLDDAPYRPGRAFELLA